MKGFLISPILFVSLMLIIGVIIINFSEIDRQIAEGIGIEGRVKKIQAEEIENITSMENMLLFGGELAASECNGCSKNSLLSKISEKTEFIVGNLGISDCKSNYFIATYNYDYNEKIFDVSIKNKNIKISGNVSCELFKKLYGASVSIDCGGTTFKCP